MCAMQNQPTRVQRAEQILSFRVQRAEQMDNKREIFTRTQTNFPQNTSDNYLRGDGSRTILGSDKHRFRTKNGSAPIFERKESKLFP